MADLVAVTGATGFVGRNLVRRLAEQGYSVRALVRRGKTVEGAEVVSGDLESPEALNALVRGARFVFHLGGRVTASNEAEFDRANVDGTTMLVKAAAEAGIERLIHVSSLAVTGPSLRGIPVDEKAGPAPVTAYGRSKLKGEIVVRDSRVPWVIARPCAVYGPHDRAFLDLFRSVARLGVAPVIGDGRQELSMIHVEDLCEALVRLAVSPGCESGLYHVAHPEVVSQMDLAAAVGAALGRPARSVRVPVPVFRAYAAGVGLWSRWTGKETFIASWKVPEYLAAAWTCRTESLQAAASFVARRGLIEGVAATAKWYANERLL